MIREDAIWADLIQDTPLPDLEPENVEELTRRVRAGQTEAMVQLGRYYHDSGTNAGRAVRLMERAADGRNDEAMDVLGDWAFGEKEYSEAVAWYTRSAALGNIRAKVKLAQFFMGGQGIRKNRRRAKSLFMEAAQAGSVPAMERLALYYYRGDFGKEPDYKEASYWFHHLLSREAAVVAPYMAEIYATGGYGVEADRHLASMYYEMSAATGEAEDLYDFAQFLMTGTGREKEKAFRLLQQAAEKHYTPAMLALCDAYRFGDGTARDRLEFVRWAKAAALAGDETGLEYLHQAFYLYHDVDLRPYCNAAALAELKAAGNGPSLYVLGKLAYTEFGASQGLCEDDAFSYWFQAAKMGYGPAEMDLGFILGEKNPKAQAKQAFAYIRDAAEQGEVRAMYPLADMYYKGKGTEPDLMASFDWVQAAAAQGEPNACLLLGLSYLSTDERYSRYVVQDHDRAVAYFKEAAAGGNLSGMSTYGIAKVMNRTCAEDAYEGLQYMETAYRLGDKNIGDILALVKKDSSLGVPKVN